MKPAMIRCLEHAGRVIVKDPKSGRSCTVRSEMTTFMAMGSPMAKVGALDVTKSDV